MNPYKEFTGNVQISPLDSFSVTLDVVTFEPKSRTYWHSHPDGQKLHIISGTAIVEIEGEVPYLLKIGESIDIKPHQRHWHGATADAPMTHIAYQRIDQNNESIEWSNEVTEYEYINATKGKN